MDELRIIFATAAVGWLAATHLTFPWFDRKTAEHREQWVSFSGGVAVGYVTLYLLPKMTDYTIVLMDRGAVRWEVLQYRLYFAFLLGLLTYLVVQRLGVAEDERPAVLPWMQGFGLCSYNILMGYFIFGFPREGLTPYVLVAGVMGIHFLGINHQVRKRNARMFDRYLRWAMAASLVVGALIAFTDNMPRRIVVVGSAYLGGAILMNVMVEELPGRSTRSLLPFLAGVFTFVLTVVAIRSAPLVS